MPSSSTTILLTRPYMILLNYKTLECQTQKHNCLSAIFTRIYCKLARIISANVKPNLQQLSCYRSCSPLCHEDKLEIFNYDEFNNTEVCNFDNGKCAPS